MSNDGFVWAEEAENLKRAAQSDSDYYEMMAAELLRPGDAVVLDFGCGAGGMAIALRDRVAQLGTHARVVGLDAHPEVYQSAATQHADITFATASFEDSVERLREIVGAAPDLIWARGALHHADDEQLALNALAELLAAGGTLALAEGGTTVAHMPRHVGVGESGLHGRLNAALEEYARGKMADLNPMPYGWLTGMRHAGLVEAHTRNTLFDKPAPLEGADLDYVLSKLGKQVDWARDHLSPQDREAWGRLLDPDDGAWLGLRDDLFYLAAASVHIGYKPR